MSELDPLDDTPISGGSDPAPATRGALDPALDPYAAPQADVGAPQLPHLPGPVLSAAVFDFCGAALLFLLAAGTWLVVPAGSGESDWSAAVGAVVLLFVVVGFAAIALGIGILRGMRGAWSAQLALSVPLLGLLAFTEGAQIVPTTILVGAGLLLLLPSSRRYFRSIEMDSGEGSGEDRAEEAGHAPGI